MTWRAPALAPVYALVIAFFVVVGIGLFTGGPASAATVVRLETGDRAESRGELAGSVIEVRAAAGGPVTTGELSERLSYELPDSAAGGWVCLRLPAQWQVTEPAMAGGCTARPLADPPAADLRFTVVRHGWVAVTFEGPSPQQGEHGTVTVHSRDDPAYSETGPLDGSGRYQPRASLAGQTVCVNPPPGWTVKTPPHCITELADPAANVGFTLVRSPGGGPR